MSRPRFVLDASVIVSAALLAGSTKCLAFEWALQHGSILLSDAVQTELSNVLLRSKSDRYLSLEKRLHFLSSFSTSRISREAGKNAKETIFNFAPCILNGHINN